MSNPHENRSDEPQPIRGQVRYSQLSARVPEHVGDGCFASAAMVMSGPYEHVLDFILRLTEKPRVVARVVLSPAVAVQFLQALKQNIANFEAAFGPLPRPPQLIPPSAAHEPADADEDAAGGSGTFSAPSDAGSGAAAQEPPPWTTHPLHPELQEPALVPPPMTNIEQIYDELRLPDSLLSGRYANAVLIRHSPTEFCFDFITNIYPRSAVSCRVYLAAANVPALMQSLQRSLERSP